MLSLNGSDCLNQSRCVLVFGTYPNEYYLNEEYNIQTDILTLPIIGMIVHDLPSLRSVYIFISIFLVLLGLINNIFSFMTFLRDRIRYTICGVYLIIYSLCSVLLMTLIITNIITAIYYKEYVFRLWACHGYPYLTSVMIYTSITISAAIAIEGVLYECYKINKSRPRKTALITSLIIFLVVAILNLDKLFARRLISNHSGDFDCVCERYSYEFWSAILMFIFIILPSLIHLICITRILSKQVKGDCIHRFFRYQSYIIPSLSIILCTFLRGIYRYLFRFYLPNSSRYLFRLHIGFTFLLYTPQILTYIIYVLPNDFYVREFYQIWFYRVLCCCFYNRRRHVQQFEVIHKLWTRRTSLETIKTISNLDDTWIDSEFYRRQ